MQFSTEREAKEFLADKISQESGLEGAPLSDVERRLLLFSEQDPGSEQGIPEDMLYDTDFDWEARMTALLRQAWQRDKADPAERQKYLDAMERLKSSDHYIQVIAGPVFGGSFLGITNVSGLPVISLSRIALWSAAGIVLFAIIALVCVAVTR